MKEEKEVRFDRWNCLSFEANPENCEVDLQRAESFPDNLRTSSPDCRSLPVFSLAESASDEDGIKRNSCDLRLQLKLVKKEDDPLLDVYPRNRRFLAGKIDEPNRRAYCKQGRLTVLQRSVEDTNDLGPYSLDSMSLILRNAARLVDDFGGQGPRDPDDLLDL
ncbi:hypothetical protein WH47_09725 [Habropoda laboriosa]|uniref:Uncharacterized protein n=1 Tax=Habropoda laboriosa TaxID=597456 RepID=A0A0L7QMH3_9HYME|nr:hypothetical protein WH47_09725 [Habropoda laboriosa]